MQTRAVGGAGWGAEPRGPAAELVAGGLDDDRLGDVGQLARDLADRLAPEDLAGPDPDPLLVPEAEQDGGEVLGPLAELGQLGPDRLGGLCLVDDQRIHQVVDHPRVADQRLGEELARRAEFDVEPERRRVEVEQLPEHSLGPERRRDLLQVRQRHVRVVCPGDGREQAGCDPGEEVATPGL